MKGAGTVGGEDEQDAGADPGRADKRDGEERTRRLDEPGESVGAGPETSTLGKGDTPNVAGTDEQQPEIAGGPAQGLQPGEEVQRGPWRPPLEVDPPEGDALPRDAAGDPEAVRRQKEEGGP
jgi:hypothetical protein